MGTLKSYTIGFIFSIALTLAAYFAVTGNIFPATTLIYTVMGLAVVQVLVQLVYFLHLDREDNPRWNLAVFISTVSLIMVLVIGTLWIMGHLNYNHTHTSDQEIIQNEAIPQ